MHRGDAADRAQSAEELLKTLTDEAMKGTVTWDKSLSNTVQQAIKKLDEALSKQLAAVLHHPDLQKLEGSYRGLRHLVSGPRPARSSRSR